MIVITFRDIRQFLLYFFIILAFMAIQIRLIYDEQIKGYESLGAMGWFIISMQLNLTSVDNESTHYIIFWVIWFLQFIVGTIVLMNFLIAVVGNSFSDCMAKREAQTLKVKVDMIYEHEDIMTEKELNDPNNFPQYILVRRPVESVSDEVTHLEHMSIMLRDTQFLVEKIPRMEEVLLQLSKTIKNQSRTIVK